MIAKCKLCKTELSCKIVGLSNEDKAVEIGRGMIAHFQKYHESYLKELVKLQAVFSGFLVMNRFTLDDEGVIEQTEDMRDKLCDAVMEDAPMTEEDEKVAKILEVMDSQTDEEDEEDDDEEDDGDEEDNHGIGGDEGLERIEGVKGLGQLAGVGKLVPKLNTEVNIALKNPIKEVK